MVVGCSCPAPPRPRLFPISRHFCRKRAVLTLCLLANIKERYSSSPGTRSSLCVDHQPARHAVSSIAVLLPNRIIDHRFQRRRRGGVAATMFRWSWTPSRKSPDAPANQRSRRTDRNILQRERLLIECRYWTVEERRFCLDQALYLSWKS